MVRKAIEPTRLPYDAEGAASLLSAAGIIAAIRQKPIRAATLCLVFPVPGSRSP